MIRLSICSLVPSNSLLRLTLIVLLLVSVVNTKPVVRNLGSLFDAQLSMSTHISKLCSSAFFDLHNISRIRKFLSPGETKSLVHAFVNSRVDYYNSLFVWSTCLAARLLRSALQPYYTTDV